MTTIKELKSIEEKLNLTKGVICALIVLPGDEANWMYPDHFDAIKLNYQKEKISLWK